MNNDLPMSLDFQDTNVIAAFLNELENPTVTTNVRVRSVTFSVYGQHRVTASRGRSRWNRLRVRKIVRIP